MPSETLTVIAVTNRFVIALDTDGQRERIETPARASVAKGDTVTREQFYALGHPEPTA